jgi:hypothetical protein
MDADGRHRGGRPDANPLILVALNVPNSFPALLIPRHHVSFMPATGLLDAIIGNLARMAPSEVLSIIRLLTLARNGVEHFVRAEGSHRHTEAGRRYRGSAAVVEGEPDLARDRRADAR